MIKVPNMRFVCTAGGCRTVPAEYVPDIYNTNRAKWNGDAYCEKHKTLAGGKNLQRRGGKSNA